MAVNEATASGDVERLSSMQQGIEEALDHDEEAIWQMVPLVGSFIFHYTVRQEGAQFVPRLLAAKERVSQSGSPLCDHQGQAMAGALGSRGGATAPGL